MQLRLRILFPILIVHLIVIPISVYKFLSHFEQPTWQAERRLAEALLREVKNQLAIHQILAGGEEKQLQKTTDHLAATHRFLGLSIYSAEGKLKAKSGQPFPALNQQHKVNKVSLSGSVIHATHWVRNEQACYSCHNSKETYIGAIQGSVSVAQVADKLAHDRRKAMFSTFASLLAVFTLIYLFHYFFIVSPVGKILQGMRKVKSGDLSVRVPVRQKDEIGMIASGFNEVVHSLKVATEELERRHQSDMARAEQLATVGEIAAGLAHEVKNPVAGISSALQVVVSEMEDSPNREILNQVIEETHRITSTVNSLLDYARPKEPKPESIDLEVFVSDMQTIFAPQCQQRRIKFQASINSNGHNFFVDVQSLKQVMMNLLRNSLEAVQAGAVIELSADADEDGVHFFIRDNGPGMDELTRSKIFQPFYTTKANGTGLGLAIVKRFVEDMNGSIRVQSTPGVETTFEIWLPNAERK